MNNRTERQRDRCLVCEDRQACPACLMRRYLRGTLASRKSTIANLRTQTANMNTKRAIYISTLVLRWCAILLNTMVIFQASEASILGL